MGPVVRAPDRDEPLIAIQTSVAEAVRADRKRGPAAIRLLHLPDPRHTVPRCADHAARARIEVHDQDSSTRTFEHRYRNAHDDVGYRDDAILARANHELGARIELDPGHTT